MPVEVIDHEAQIFLCPTSSANAANLHVLSARTISCAAKSSQERNSADELAPSALVRCRIAFKTLEWAGCSLLSIFRRDFIRPPLDIVQHAQAICNDDAVDNEETESQHLGLCFKVSPQKRLDLSGRASRPATAPAALGAAGVCRGKGEGCAKVS